MTVPVIVALVPAQPAPLANAPRGTLIGTLSVTNENGVKIPCKFTVVEPTSWFKMSGNRLLSNWDPKAVYPAPGAISPGAHQVTILATPIGFTYRDAFTITVTPG
jgi:hypothetical protein